jgi:hypothetical protein
LRGRETFLPDNSTRFNKSNYNSSNINTLDHNQSVNNILYSSIKTQENLNYQNISISSNKINHNNPNNNTISKNRDLSNNNNISLTRSLNLSESANATKLNPLVFPPNNKKNNQSNNLTLTSSNINISNNKDSSDTSNSQKFINEIKNSNRINRISNLLGRIFNKKLDQIQSKNQHQNNINSSNNYSSLNLKNTDSDLYNNSESYFSNYYNYNNIDKRLYDSLSPRHRKRAEIEKVCLDEILPPKKLMRNNSERFKNLNEYIKYERILTENYADNNNDYHTIDNINMNNKFLKRSQSDYNIENENVSISLLNLGGSKINIYDKDLLENINEINIELNKKTEKNQIINNIQENIFSEKNKNFNNKEINIKDKTDKTKFPVKEKFINEKLQISKINSGINFIPTKTNNNNHNHNNKIIYSKNNSNSNDFRNISYVNIIKEENFNENFSEDLNYLNNHMINNINFYIPSDLNNLNNSNLLSDRERDKEFSEKNKNISVLENVSINDSLICNSSNNIKDINYNKNQNDNDNDNEINNLIYERNENSFNCINNSIETGKFAQSNRNSDLNLINNNNNVNNNNIFQRNLSSNINIINNNEAIKIINVISDFNINNDNVEENSDSKSNISNGINKNIRDLSNNNIEITRETTDKNNLIIKKEDDKNYNNDKESINIKIQENFYDDNNNNTNSFIQNNNNDKNNCEIYKKKPKSNPKINIKKENKNIEDYPFKKNRNNNNNTYQNKINKKTEPIMFSSETNKSIKNNNIIINKNNNNNNIFIQENEEEEYNQDLMDSFNFNKTSSLNVISEEESKDYETLNFNERDELDFGKSKKEARKISSYSNECDNNKLLDSLKEKVINRIDNVDKNLENHNVKIYQNKKKNLSLNYQQHKIIEKPLSIIQNEINKENKENDNDRKLELNDLIEEKNNENNKDNQIQLIKIEKNIKNLKENFNEDVNIPLSQYPSIKIKSISGRSRSKSRKKKENSVEKDTNKDIKKDKNKIKNKNDSNLNDNEIKLVNKILNSSPNSSDKIKTFKNNNNNIKIINLPKEEINSGEKKQHNISINQLTSDIKNIKNENNLNDDKEINESVSIININQIQEEVDIFDNFNHSKIKEENNIENFIKNDLLNNIICSLFDRINKNTNKNSPYKKINNLDNSHFSQKENQEDTIDIEISLIKQISLNNNNNCRNKFELDYANNQENNLIISKSNNIFYENSYQIPYSEEKEREKEKNLNSPENNLLQASANFNSISFIEFYNNSNSELFLPDENRKYSSIEINSNFTNREKDYINSIYNNNFIPEKQIYLQLNSIGPKKIVYENNHINENEENDYIIENENNINNSNNENYYRNNNEKSQLEIITEHIDLENMNSMSEFSKSGYNNYSKNDNTLIINPFSPEEKIPSFPLNNFNSSLININKNKNKDENPSNNNNNTNVINNSPFKKSSYRSLNNDTSESNKNSCLKENPKDYIRYSNENMENIKKTKFEILEKCRKLQENLALYSPQNINKNEEKIITHREIKDNNKNPNIINNNIPNNDFIKIVEEENIQKSNEKQLEKFYRSEEDDSDFEINDKTKNINSNNNNNIKIKSSTPTRSNKSLSNVAYFSPSLSENSNVSNINLNSNSNILINDNDNNENDLNKRNSFKKDTFTLINNSLIKQKKKSFIDKKNLSEVKIIRTIKNENFENNGLFNTVKLPNRYNNNIEINQSERKSTQIYRNDNVNLNKTTVNINNNNTFGNLEDNIYNFNNTDSAFKLKEFKSNPNFNSNKVKKIIRKIKSKQEDENYNYNNYLQTDNNNLRRNSCKENDFININESIDINNMNNTINNNKPENFNNLFEKNINKNENNTSIEYNDKKKDDNYNLSFSNKSESTNNKENSKFNSIKSNTISVSNLSNANNNNNSKSSSKLSFLKIKNVKAIGKDKDKEERILTSKKKDKGDSRLKNTPKYNNINVGNLTNFQGKDKIQLIKNKENVKEILQSITPFNSDKKNKSQNQILNINNNSNLINVNNSSDDYLNKLPHKQNLNGKLEKIPNSLRDFTSLNEIDISNLYKLNNNNNINSNNNNQKNNSITSRTNNNNSNLKGNNRNSLKRANSKSYILNNNNNQSENLKFKTINNNNTSYKGNEIKGGNKLRYVSKNISSNNINLKNINTSKGKKINDNYNDDQENYIESTSNLVLDKCIDNLKVALENYIRASRTVTGDKNLLKTIIKENFLNIKKENELQKSLNYERERENKIANKNSEKNINNNNNNIFNYSNYNHLNKDVENLNFTENYSRNFSDKEKENSNENINENIDNNVEDIFNEDKFGLLSDDPEDIKNFIITELESFKLGLVKDRLEKYFEKIQNETASVRSDVI